MITGEMFEPVLDSFAACHRVIVPDLRGHGQSRGLPPPYTVEQLALDLARLLDNLGVGAAAILGYSQGGAVAQQLALDHPSLCNRLVLACTYAFNMASFRERVEGHLVPLFLRFLGMRRFAKLVLSLGLKQVPRERAERATGLIADQDLKLMLPAWNAAMAFDSRPRLAEIHCRTLVIAGSKDEAVPLRHAITLHNGIAGSKLVVVDGADHSLLWSHPDELFRLTEEFLGV